MLKVVVYPADDRTCIFPLPCPPNAGISNFIGGLFVLHALKIEFVIHERSEMKGQHREDARDTNDKVKAE